MNLDTFLHIVQPTLKARVNLHWYDCHNPYFAGLAEHNKEPVCEIIIINARPSFALLKPIIQIDLEL